MYYLNMMANFGGMMGYDIPTMMGGFGFGFGWFFMVLFWVLIVTGIIYLIRCLVWGCPPRGGAKKSAIEILEERYAKGEISKEEFEEKKKDLI